MDRCELGIKHSAKGCPRSLRICFAFFLFILVSSLSPLTSSLYSQSLTEFGMEGDLTVLGRLGTAVDPNVEIKGFTVFGSTQSGYTGMVPGDGNVVVNGFIAVSSGVYFVDTSTFTSAHKIFINDGSEGQILVKSAAGNLNWQTATNLGDNMGNHIATTTLNMNGNSIVNAASGTFSSAITASSFTATGTGLNAAQLRFNDGNVVISSANASQLGGVYVSTNLYVVGVASATKYYGDGFNLTGVVSRYSETRTLSGGTQSVEIGSFIYSPGTHNLYLSVSIGDGSSWSVTKQYALPLSRNMTRGVWSDALPLSNSGAAAAPSSPSDLNDFALQVKIDNFMATEYASFRLRRTSGALTCSAMINIEQLGASDDLFVPASASADASGSFPLLSVTPLTQTGGNVGIGTANPSARLHISSGTLTIDGNAANSIITNGNVGIGTTAPAYNLHVAGNAVVTSSLAVTGTTLTGQTPVFQVLGNALTVSANGNVGIGTDTPKGMLHVGAGDVPALLVTSDGIVGISTAAPVSDGAKLVINGQIKIADGTQGMNKVLTSDANGVGSWQVSGSTFSIGDQYGGGTVFWVDSLGKQILIAGPSDLGNVQWGNDSNPTGATLDGIYAGKANTVMISTMQEEGLYAAHVCSNYGVTADYGSGTEYYDDWYLPSLYELSLLYAQKNVVGGFLGAYYWSSTEYSDSPTNAYAVNFNGGVPASRSKLFWHRIRCIRGGPTTAIGTLPTNAETVTDGAYRSSTQTFTGSNFFKDITAVSLTASSASFTNTSGVGLMVSSSAYLAVSGGNVGIGTSAPAYGLEVINPAGVHFSTTSSSGYGLYLNSVGTVGIGTAAPQAALDIVSTGTLATQFDQIWRNGAGVVVGSISATGVMEAVKFIGDGSAITGVSDNLGNHIATMTVTANFGVLSSTAISAGYYQINGSTVLAQLPGAGSLGVGIGAGNLSTGINNTFVGSSAAYSGTTGDNNSVVGSAAGYNNQTGSANVIFGSKAGGFGSGGANSFSSSTIVGYQAGYSLRSGSADNILVGYQAGYNVTTGTGNIVIGYNKDTSAPGASNELNIGGLLYADLSAKTVGISTRTPQAALDIVSTGTAPTQFAQIWRASDGVIKASMSATGVMKAKYFIGDGGGITNIPVDNLGNHIATMTLNMAGFNIQNAGYITASSAALSGELVVYGTTTLRNVSASSVTLSDQLTVYGTTTLRNVSASSVTLSDQLIVYGTATLKYVTASSVTLSDQLTVYGTTTLRNVAASSVTLSGQLIVYGSTTLRNVTASSATLSDQLTVYGTTTLRYVAAASATLSDQLIVYGTATLRYATASSATLSDQLMVYGTTTLRYVTASSATLSDQLVVYGSATLRNLSASSATLSDQLTVYGTTTLKYVTASSAT